MKNFSTWRNVTVILIALILIQFQNCGDVKISTPSKTAERLIASRSQFSLPKRVHDPQKELRLVLLFDLSQSMGFGICPSEVDVLLKDVMPSPNCMKESGADSNGNRFQVALQWLEELSQKVTEQKLDSRKIKISVNFFSGGIGQQSLSELMQMFNNISIIKPPSSDFKLTGNQYFTTPFLNLENARTYIYLLWSFHHHHMLNAQGDAFTYNLIPQLRNRTQAAELQRIYLSANLPRSRLTSGTSVPKPALEQMILNISQELNILKRANKSADSEFEVVIFSDGVAKPRPAHISKVLDILWKDSNSFNTPCDQRTPGKYDLSFCASRCSVYREKMAELGAICDYYSTEFKINRPCSLPLEERWVPREGGACESFKFSFNSCQTCVSYLENFSLTDNPNLTAFDQMRSYWGDWSLNSHLQIIKSFNKLRNVFLLQYPEANFDIHLVRLDNFYSLFKLSVGELDPEVNWFLKIKELYPSEVASYLMNQPIKPFTPFHLSGSNDRLRIETAIALNLNLRVDNENLLVVDSDADGVPDSVEVRNGMDPSKARSDGKCLDVIRLKYGSCVDVGCDLQLDRDQDGLNECEESTIGTDDRNFDTDGDGIPDGIEEIFGLNPLQKDNNLDLNGDGKTNFEQLRMGLMPYAKMALVPPQNKINFVLNYLGEQTPGTTGQPTYNIQMGQMPLAPTGAAKESSRLYIRAPYADINVNPLFFLARNHERDTNVILMLFKVSNLSRQNDISWYYSAQPLRTKSADQLNLDFSAFKKIE